MKTGSTWPTALNIFLSSVKWIFTHGTRIFAGGHISRRS